MTIIEIKTLKGPALEYATAMAEGYSFGECTPYHNGKVFPMYKGGTLNKLGSVLLRHERWHQEGMHYLTEGNLLIKIMERERISAAYIAADRNWQAQSGLGLDAWTMPSRDIAHAVLRFYVKLWKETDLIYIPDEVMEASQNYKD